MCILCETNSFINILRAYALEHFRRASVHLAIFSGFANCFKNNFCFLFKQLRALHAIKYAGVYSVLMGCE